MHSQLHDCSYGLNKDQDLSPQEALTYFDKSEVSSLPPVRLKGGETYLFSARDDPSKNG